MTARKLADLERARFVGKATAQVGFERGQVKLFALSNSRWMVQQVAHLKVSLTIGQHCRIADMPVRIESAERKSLRGVEKFTPRRVPRHPTHL